VIRRSIGQRYQQDRIHYAEDCCVRTDAQPHYEDDKKREAGCLAYAADRISKVLE
jgi:hypothetical protein